MRTGTYGLKIPETNDTGADGLFTWLEDDLDQIDEHDHDGINSPQLTAASVAVVTQSIASGSWGATVGDGLYRQTITLPGSLNFDAININIKNASGHQVFLQVEKVSTTQYYVYTNDNTTTYTAVYSS
jgi:hypothetical protein